MFNNIKLQELLEKNNISQHQLAEKVGVSQPFISYVAMGLKEPSFPLACRIAKVFEVPVDLFIKKEV